MPLLGKAITDRQGEKMEREYTCDSCHEVFEEGWTDEEASAEFCKSFPEHDIRDAAVVCDDCYKMLMGNE